MLRLGKAHRNVDRENEMLAIITDTDKKKRNKERMKCVRSSKMNIQNRTIAIVIRNRILNQYLGRFEETKIKQCVRERRMCVFFVCVYLCVQFS